jgi:general secretion pathway protein C
MTDELKSQKLWSRIQGKLRVEKYPSFKQALLKLRPNINWKNVANQLQSLDLQKTTEWISKKVQDRGFAFYGKLGTVIVCNYFLADLSALLVGDYLPNPATGAGRPRSSFYSRGEKLNADYPAIAARNLFNSKGLIPGENDGVDGLGSDAAPTKSNLPLNLIGTLVMSNPAHSIATIEDKAQSQIFPVGIDDEIPGKLKVQLIEPRKVIFVNKISGRREYIEIPEDQDTKVATRFSNSGGSTGATSVEKVSPTQFNVPRGEVDRALADFNNLLTQARAVPNSENGLPAGYKLFQIIPGSLYDKLGLQNGDVITGLNGQIINDPGKAFEMLNELKTSNHLELQIKKDGKPLNYVYDIHP